MDKHKLGYSVGGLELTYREYLSINPASLHQKDLLWQVILSITS